MLKNALIKKLLYIIKLSRTKPYLPLWGEIFDVLVRLRKATQVNTPIYEIDPIGDVIYDPNRRSFIVRVPGMDVVLKDDEMVDAILTKGVFHPKMID